MGTTGIKETQMTGHRFIGSSCFLCVCCEQRKFEITALHIFGGLLILANLDIMYEVFFQTLRLKVPFSDDDLALIKLHLMPKKLRKKQYLLQEGDVCKFI